VIVTKVAIDHTTTTTLIFSIYCEGVGFVQKLPLKATTTKDLSRQGEPTLGRRPRGSCKERKEGKILLAYVSVRRTVVAT
jgi:hypothetical protein